MREQIVIVGSGIAGMCTALALARRGHDITVVERDGEPPEGDADAAFFQWQRRGAAQFRHPHAFLGLMCNILQDNYPDLFAQFEAAGARRVGFKDMLPAELARGYQPAPGDDRLFVLLCRRATIETVLRRYVRQLPGVTIKSGVTIDGVVTSADMQTGTGTGSPDAPIDVLGLKLRRDCIAEHGAEIRADIIIDASGRMTRFPRWFAELGVPVEEESTDAEIVYYTRHYKLKPGQQEPPRDSEDRANGDLGYLKFGVFPGDNGHFSVIVCLHNSELELREAITDGARFDAICRQIPGLCLWVDETVAEATTGPLGIGDIRGVWRHYVRDGRPLARNFFAVGDAALRTNPLYGRGCSTSILHAHMVAEVISDIDDPLERARVFDARTEAELRPIFAASRSEDLNGIKRAKACAEGRVAERPDGFKGWFAAAFGDAMAAAMRYNLHVLRGALRTMHLLEKPGEFLSDRRTRLIIMAYMLRGRARNALARRQRGPARDEMLEFVRDLASS